MNSKKHLYVSIVKSVIRSVGCILGIATNSIILFAIFFLGAEALGILEEMVDERWLYER